MLSAETQITNLLFTYAERIDGGDINGVADLFAHAVLAGADGREARGRDGAMAWFGGRGGGGERRKTKHVTTNVIIELDDAGTRA